MSIHVSLDDQVVLRSLTRADAAALAKAYLANREYLAPWEPVRAESFFTYAGQQAEIEPAVASFESGTGLPLVLVDGARIIGRVGLSRIVRGALQSADLGYWVDAGYRGRGLMTAAVGAVVRLAEEELRLHRIQASTLIHNAASQSVLTKCGFIEFGLAPEYLCIAGSWQDHRLFQRILAP